MSATKMVTAKNGNEYLATGPAPITEKEYRNKKMLTLSEVAALLKKNRVAVFNAINKHNITKFFFDAKNPGANGVEAPTGAGRPPMHIQKSDLGLLKKHLDIKTSLRFKHAAKKKVAKKVAKENTETPVETPVEAQAENPQLEA